MKKNVRKLLMSIAIVVAAIMFVFNIFKVYYEKKEQIFDETRNINGQISRYIDANGKDTVPDLSGITVNSMVTLLGVDKNNSDIIAASHPKYIGQKLSDIGIDTDIKEDSLSGQAIFGGKYYVVIKYSYDGFDLYYLMNLATIIRSIIVNSFLVLFGTFFVFLVIIHIVINYIDKNIVKVIDRINKGLDDITTNYDAPDIDENSTPEFERLSEHINFMKDSVVGNAKDAQEAVKAKSNFLSTMSHEIRTPINAVLGLDEMILRDSNEPSTIKYAEDIRSAGKTLLSLINDILDSSKIESGNMELVESSYKLSTVLTDVYNMILFRAEKKGLEFICDINPEIPNILKGDEVRIKQCMVNLLTNAVKYTEKGGIIFMVSYKKPEHVSDTILLNIAIEDTGIGIKENDIKKLFSEFERIEEKRNRNIEGTGLGMNITKSLLEMMGSRLQVESEYGRGSTFSFSLKQKVASWAPIGDFDKAYKASVEKHTVYKERIEAPDARVLVTDDNIMNLQVFAGLLKQTKIIIDTALSGDEAIALTMKNKYDIIFMDHMMPEKDGIETFHEIREQDDNPNCDTAVICLTANAISGAKEEYLNHGFDGYLSKPIDAGKLEDLLIKFLPDDKVNILGKEAEKTDEVVIPEIFVRLREENLLDIDSGIKNSGSFDSFMSLLRIFYTSIDEKVEEIDTSFKENDINNYTIKVHALKSSARIVGANDFGEDAQLLENAGKEGNIDFIKDNHEYFLSKYRKFKDILKEVFDDDKDDKQKPEADPDLLDEVYKELKLAAEDMDCDKLSAIFEEMEDYSIPESEKEKWNRLKTASDNYDYDEISRIIEFGN